MSYGRLRQSAFARHGKHSISKPTWQATVSGSCKCSSCTPCGCLPSSQGTDCVKMTNLRAVIAGGLSTCVPSKMNQDDGYSECPDSLELRTKSSASDCSNQPEPSFQHQTSRIMSIMILYNFLAGAFSDQGLLNRY